MFYGGDYFWIFLEENIDLTGENFKDLVVDER